MRGCKGIPLSLSICFLLHGAGIELGIPTFTVCVWEEMGYIKSSTQQKHFTQYGQTTGRTAG